MLEYNVALEQVRRQATELFGEQISLSYPLPDKIGGVAVEKYFLYPAGGKEKRSRPFGLLTVFMETGGVAMYQDCRVMDFVDADEHPLDEKISYQLPVKIGVKEYKVGQGLLNKLYAFVREIAFKDELSAQEREILGDYLAVLEGSVPVALLPYYQAMGKNFYEWGYQYV